MNSPTLKEQLEPIAKECGLWSMIRNLSDPQMRFFLNAMMAGQPADATFEEMKQIISLTSFGGMINLLSDASQRRLFEMFVQHKLNQDHGFD